LWVLRLVPDVPLGRWLAGGVAFALMAGVLASAGEVFGSDGGFTGYVRLFFCVIVAYIIPVFHYITARTEQDFDAVSQLLGLDEEERASLRRGIAQKSWPWVLGNLGFAVSLWMLQSWLLAGADNMVAAFANGLQPAVQASAPLIVWIVMTCVIHALIDNAVLFRRLVKRVKVDIYDTRLLKPFGSMAVSSILAVVGAQASFSIMWLEDTTSAWTTIPGLILTTIALAYLFFAPVWPLHKAILAAKNAELGKLQARINQALAQDRDDYARLVPLLTLRREVHGITEWPVDVGLLARLGLYLVIVPLTWIGAALIENVVDLFVA
jgi:hypothetical protein